MKDEEKLPLINQLNTYNYSFIKVGTDHLRFMDMTVKSPEWQKGWLLFHLGVSYRSLITNDVEQQKVYLDMSLDYYKRFAQITSCEDFKKNVNAAGQVFVGLTAEEHIARTDQEKFLQTFRIDL